ncbi:ABC transporter permease [Candidatus Spongiisocius sp.]|uniref:ABC transporter permease n=1 Tax=Candidatus Spongiisocius sp. TaxID=3101273 RepID=UPI003B5A3EA1
MTLTAAPPPSNGPGPGGAGSALLEVTPEFERAAARADSRRGFLLSLPAYVYLVLFFAIPFGIVVVYSLATRNTIGGTDLAGWNLDSYRRLAEPIVRDILFRSVWIAVLTTLICLVVAYPFSYFIATRTPTIRNILLVFVMIPFWTNFLVRNYAWRVILGSDGPFAAVTEALGVGRQEILFTHSAVILGLVYGYLPFMVLPLYAAIERIDGSLIEAGRDLYASGAQTFRRVLLPLSMPGVLAGSILVFVPSLGAYVTPQILGGGKSTMLGSYIVVQFLTARNWPLGASLSFVLMTVMLTATLIYFRAGGRNL